MRQDNLPGGIRVEGDTLLVDTLREDIHVAEDTLREDSHIRKGDNPVVDNQLEGSHGEDMVQKGKLHGEDNVLLQQRTQQD